MTISPWHGVTTVVMGNCGFGVAPTRPEHRGLIMRTLENVEGMSLKALETGLGYEWPFESFEQYMDTIERRGTAINLGALVGHTPIRLYVMGEEATERPATVDEVAAHEGAGASRARRGRDRLRDLEVADPRRPTAASRCRAACRTSTNQERLRRRWARRATESCRRR